MTATESFRAAMHAASLDYAGPILTDGQLHRFRAEGDHERNSWYILHTGPPAAGAFGCWKRDLKDTWCERNGKELSETEWQHVRERWQHAEREREREQIEGQRHERARNFALSILARSKPAQHHAYLAFKGVKPHGELRERLDALAVPLRDAQGVLHSLQFIGADSSKRFLTGGRISGCCFSVADKPDGPLVICEGYATGASIHEATGHAVVCAMNCGNLMAVAKDLRAKWPSRDLIIAADNDAFSVDRSGKPYNPGVEKATEAAAAVNARLAVPAFKNTTTHPTDFNDLHQSEGGDVVKAQIDSAAPQNESQIADAPRQRKSVATRLVELASQLDFLHDPQDRAFVRLKQAQHNEVWPVGSKPFRNWLAHQYYKRTGSAANRNSVSDALMVLESRARFDSPEEAVFLRIAPLDDGILIDLCDRDWRVVEVTPRGWRILKHSPVPFFRTQSMRPLPGPASEGSVAPLWDLLNVTPAQRSLLAGCLMNSFHPRGPYFVASLIGEQGSAKSTAARIMRSLVDPNEIPLRSPPREERDLLVHAANNWCVVFDNLSGLPPWLSDGLCRLATGGGHSARQLYTDGDEFTLAVKRPVIINGIDDVAARPDLAERALQLELEPIPDHKRMVEAELWKRFEQQHPAFFAALLKGIVRGLSDFSSVKVEHLPRMADATVWATAAEPALGWKRGTFISVYWQNLSEGAVASLDAHPIGVAVRELLGRSGTWSGEPAELLATLNENVSDEVRHGQKWPHNPRALSVCLRRLAQALRRAGIAFETTKGQRRLIHLCNGADFASPASFGSPKPAEPDARDAKDASIQPMHDVLQLVDSHELTNADLL